MNKLIHRLIASDRLTLLTIISTLLATTIILLSFLVLYQSLPPKIPMYYSLVWGESQLVLKSQFLILPVISILITLINIFLASYIHPSQKVLRQILLLTIPFVNIVLLISVLKIFSIFI